MNRVQAYCGILTTGVASMLVTLEAARQAAFTLRDEAEPDSDRRDRLKTIAKVLDDVGLDLRDVESELAALRNGEGCAS